MLYRKLDQHGDYVLGAAGRSGFMQNTPDAVGQAVLTRLSLWTDTWFTDLADGTPWRTNVLGKYPSSVYDPILRKRILETEGVLSLPEYASQYDANARTLSLQATINTVYGQTTINGTLT